MTGGFVLVVGPSGAGKDTLIGLARDALAGDARFLFATRVVTRAADGSEAHDSLDDEAFAASEAAGGFCLSWQAHGLRYGIPASALAAARNGIIVLCNISRAKVAEARLSLLGVSVVEVTAPPDILASRLAARRRDSDGDLRARLQRDVAIEGQPPELRIVNSGSAEDGAAELLRHLRHRAMGIAA